MVLPASDPWRADPGVPGGVGVGPADSSTTFVPSGTVGEDCITETADEVTDA
jgi:hypothetical protein